MRRLGGMLVAVALTSVACSSKASAQTVTIVSTNTECRVSDTALKAGKTTFTLENKGSKFTEAYVYGKGDRVITERENVGPGTKATFSATLPAGEYEAACKPGQLGNGIRQKIQVTGKLKSAGPVKLVSRTIAVTAKDYSFEGLEGFNPKAGETVEFALRNEGAKDHEFEVLGPDGKALGEVGPTHPAADGKVTLTLAKPGAYSYVCGIEDHEKRGMKGTFTVS
jgi:uncharacterized cupredoxin-like copper-binding protein